MVQQFKMTPAQSQLRASLLTVRTLADQALSRAAGAPLIGGNRVRLLKDAAANYPAWLEAIASARHHVHFESYIIHEDVEGRRFADALIAKAREGVAVRVIYDWMGGFGKASRDFWARMREGGVDVRCYNPPRLDAPLGWLSRDHRKMVSVDGEVGFVSGLCVGRPWSGIPEEGLEPWRDTGLEIRGPAVLEVERAFAQVWEIMGPPLPADAIRTDPPAPVGDTNVRIVASVPSTAGMLRVDQLIAAIARERIWLTDAYYAGTTAYAQALRAAALEGVDVRLLLPGATDIPLLRPLSRSGYRTLLEAGVRIFEWNGTMLHAKTAVVDGRWARVGSTNLNVASWFNNCELDAVVEDQAFAGQLEAQYLEDLGNATEVVLTARRRVHAPGRPKGGPRPRRTSGGGGSGPVAAGAARLGHALGAAFGDRRVLGPVESRLSLAVGVALLVLSLLFAFFPRALAWPVAVLGSWISLSLLLRSFRLSREAARRKRERQG